MGITLYTHRCPECGLTYRVALNRTRHTLLRTRCPDCKSKSYFDNTDGSLEFLPRKRRLSFAIRQYDLVEGRDFEKQRNEPPARTVEEAIQRHAQKTRKIFGAQENEEGYLLVGLTGSRAKPRKPRLPVHRQEGTGNVVPVKRNRRADGRTKPETAGREKRPETAEMPGASPRPAQDNSNGNNGGRLENLPSKTVPPAAEQLPPAAKTAGTKPEKSTPPLVKPDPAARAAPASKPAAPAPTPEPTTAANPTPAAKSATSPPGEKATRDKAAGSDSPVPGPKPSRSPGQPRPAKPREKPASVEPKVPRAAAAATPYENQIARDLEPVRLEPIGQELAESGDIPVVQARQVLWQNPDTRREPGESRSAYLARTAKETLSSLARLPGEVFTMLMELVYVPGELFKGKRSTKEALALGGLYAFLLSQMGLLIIFLIFQFPQLIFFQDPDSFLPRLLPVASNRILDREGRLLAELFKRKTSTLRLEEVPTTLRDKLIFIEDEHFYEHEGIRWSSIARAALRNARALEYVEGGSTLTQQLSRIVLRRRDRTLLRKFREAVMAAYFERILTKDQILGAYINHVYMGHGAYGMQVASEFYFNRPLKNLNFVEELMLVALLPAPEKLSPLHNPSLLNRRLDILYERMAKEGFTAVTPGIYQVQKRRLFQKFNRSPNENVFAVRFNEAPYVAEYVRLLVKKVLGEEWQYDSSLTIHTTIDGRLQRTAGAETVAYINRIAKKFPPRRIVPLGPDQNRIKKILTKEYRAASLGGYLMGMPVYRERPPRLQAAAIGMMPGTGEILFIQGGSEFSANNQLNRAIGMRRQTGSAIKPIVYSAGIERGLITPATQIKDEPLNMGSWEPKNFNDKYSGSVSVRTALAKSLNVPSVRIGMRVGMKGLSNQFQKFFFADQEQFKKRFRSDYTIAIGSLEMSPLEMAVAFSAFGNNGVIHRPFLVREIKDPTGRVLYSYHQKDEFNMRIPTSHRAIPGDVAQIMASLLKGSAQNGGVGRGGFKGGPLLGKTGTSNDSRDAWFIGIVPNLVAAVWVGYDEAIYVMPGGTGAGVAGPLWGRIVSKGMKVGGDFQFSPRARYVTICSATGRLARKSCPRTYTELFSSSIRPSTHCWKHGAGGSKERKERKERRDRQERRDRRERLEKRRAARKEPGRENPAPSREPSRTPAAPSAPAPAPAPRTTPAPRPAPRQTPPPAPRAAPRPAPAPAPVLPPLPPTPTVRKPVQASL